MMKTLNLYKYLIAALFISLLFTGCSHKSKGSNSETEVGFAGADQNVTVGTPFTVTANSTLDGDVTYKWAENNTTLSNEASYTGTLGQGAHTLTATAISSNGQTQSDRVSIKIGKYFIKRAYTDENADGTIDTVQVYTYDAEGKLLKIETYADVNGEREPEKNGITPSIERYNYDANGNLTGTTIIDKDGKESTDMPSINSGYLSTSTPVTVTNSDGSTTKTTSYDTSGDGNKDTRLTLTSDENGNTVSGTRSGPDGNFTMKYISDENGKIIKEIAKNEDTGEIITTSYDDKGKAIKIETDTNGDGTVDKTISTEYEYIFMWKY